jgi:magnesium transporter
MYIFNPNKREGQYSSIIEEEKQVIFASTNDSVAIDWLKENGLHLSLIEDIQSDDQSITYDEIGESKLKIMKYLLFDDKVATAYNVSILYMKNKLFILSKEPKVIDCIKNSYLKNSDDRHSPSYLLYLFPDIIIDNNNFLLGEIEDRLEKLEENIFNFKAEENLLHRDIYYIRRTLDKILKISTQERDSLRKGYDYLSSKEKDTLQYEYLDLKEHIRYLIDESKALLERSEYLQNLHTGMLSTYMNKAMQKLAAISLIFLPLTFIAGVYGMNFIYMPELTWKYGYFIVWLFYIVIAVVVFVKLRKMRWL